MKYRKKPVVVDAIQWIANDISTQNAQQFVGRMENMDGDIDGERFYRSTALYNEPDEDTGNRERIWPDDPINGGRLWIETNHTWALIESGEWIIRDSRGAYPCKPDIFTATYEPVTEEQNA